MAIYFSGECFFSPAPISEMHKPLICLISQTRAKYFFQKSSETPFPVFPGLFSVIGLKRKIFKGPCICFPEFLKTIYSLHRDQRNDLHGCEYIFLRNF